jgi:hypothetical protein
MEVATTQPLSLAESVQIVAIAYAFISAGFYTAKNYSIAYAAMAAAASVAFAYWQGRWQIVGGHLVLFSIGFLPRLFWDDIKHWFGRYHNWSKLHPEADALINGAAIFAAVWMLFL